MKALPLFLISLIIFFICILIVTNHKKSDVNQNINYASHARQALDQVNAARAYPNPTIPESGFSEAFVLAKRDLLAKRNADLQLPPWRAIGPHNVGGRTLAIALNPQNPNTIYAGSASGGLWRSYTGGRGKLAWENVQTGFPVLGVAAIAIAQNDSNTIYIGTGEVYGAPESFPGIGIRTTRGSYGIGILKTEDGGLTWQKSLDWAFFQRRGVQKIRINPQNHNTVWAATTEGTYQSTDAGNSWQKAHNVIMATDIAINPADTNIVFIACGGMGSPGHGIYRSLDGGQTWTKRSLGPRGPSEYLGKAILALSPSSPNIVYASIGLNDGDFDNLFATWLMRSVDHGETWTVMNSLDYSRYQGWYSHYVGVHPQNSKIVYCGGVNLYKSIDAGSELSALEDDTPYYLDGLHPDHHDIAFHPSDPNIVYFASDGGVHRTTNGGVTFESCNDGYQTTQFYNGFSSSWTDSSLAIGGLQDNNSVLYEGELAWRRVGCCDGGWAAINQIDNNTFYFTGQFLRVFRTSDRAQSWDLIGVEPDNQPRNFIAPIFLSPADNLTLYAGASKVYKSPNGGSTWQVTNNGDPVGSNPVIAMAGSHQNADVLYIATSPLFSRARLYRTINGGANWQNITGNLPDRYPTDLAVDPYNDAIIYVTFGGFGTSHLFKSENRGENWHDAGSELPDLPTWAIAVDPSATHHIYAGSDLGVFLSANKGRDWQVFEDGLPDAVIAFDLSISLANQSLRVATHGNGVFERPLYSQISGQDNRTLPTDFVLEQNYPNPFNPDTRIRYFVSQAGHTELTVLNTQGREIRTLVNRNVTEGWKETLWDGADDSGERVASGVYIYRLKVGEAVLSKRMTLLK
ncbi:MAG: T9SS type A sorting domain-containing protein [bacterium]